MTGRDLWASASRWVRGTVPGADAAYYDRALGEFILPYATVRASDPDSLLLSFLQSTYEAAAAKGNWGRRALDSKPVL
jgi:hypothetical protein